MLVLLHLGDLGFWVVPLGYLAVVTVPLAVKDVRTLRLPNALVVPGLVVLAWALVGSALAGYSRAIGGAERVSADDSMVHGYSPTIGGVVGLVVVGGVLAVGWMVGGVGMGDVKLGAWLGGLAGMMGVFQRADDLATGLLVGAALATGLGGLESASRLRVEARDGRGAGTGPSSELRSGPRRPPAPLRIPLGPPILAAFWVTVCSAWVPSP